LGIKLSLPIKIKVDNVGEINLAKNFSLSQNTKQIDICQHFAWVNQQEGMINTIFVRLEDNKESILAKNTSEEIFLYHQSKLMQDVRTIK
jgi:hypothetical protein